MSVKEQVDKERLPEHIAIIMDGNGRWAKKRGRIRIFGHENGVRAVREAAESAAELGVKYLTLYAFSSENWRRPENEIKALMSLLVRKVKREMKTLHENDIRLNTIGDIRKLGEDCYLSLQQAMEETRDHKRMVLTLALNYSGRWDISQAVSSLTEDVAKGELLPGAVTTELINRYLSTAPMPDPELLIRTSGEHRISNFLLWQLAYSELYFCSTLWPDFRKEHLYKALIDYQSRERRFGQITEQLNNK
jgi:undecaprenyl diphosphate synthase